jgi:hypothetical protein
MIATQPAGLADITVEAPDPGPDRCLIETSQPITAALKAFADFAGTVGESGSFSAEVGLEPSDAMARMDRSGWLGQSCSDPLASVRRQHPVRANETLWLTGSTAVATPTFVDHSMRQRLQGQGGPTIEKLSGGSAGPSTERTCIYLRRWQADDHGHVEPCHRAAGADACQGVTVSR